MHYAESILCSKKSGDSSHQVDANENLRFYVTLMSDCNDNDTNVSFIRVNTDS